MLDVRFSRRWYATVLAGCAAVFAAIAFLSLHRLLLLELTLTLANASANLFGAALGGWLSNIHRRGSPMDGTVPTLVNGYGGYGISQTPEFVGSIYWTTWLQQGYTLVITNIRGGAEYGKSWHLGGNLNKKQNVFDDFSACAQYLIDNHWSSPAHMAAIGGSNGGLLMGAEITQHPEQFRHCLLRRHLRHAPGRTGPKWTVQHHRVWNGERRCKLSGALRLFALSPRRRWCEVSPDSYGNG